MSVTDCKKPVVYIVGPTASGKTGLSVWLAERFRGEILSGDSMQIYASMHIASAAPDRAEMRGVPHHLFEVIPPDVSYSVSRYLEQAGQVIDDMHRRGRLPFVVGGTGLYISSLAEHIDFGEDGDDGSCRRQLEMKAAEVGMEEMYRYLCEIDPESGEKISPNDGKRILRAIEVYQISGKTMSQRVRESRKSGPVYHNLMIGLSYRNRELLYDRINRRVDQMLDNGLLDEAKAAFERGGATAAQAIGHKEFFPYFRGEQTLDQAVERLKMQTRRYAKRQMTWFRRMEQVHWIMMDEDPAPVETAAQLIRTHLHESDWEDVL